MFPLLILQTWKGKMDVISFFPPFSNFSSKFFGSSIEVLKLLSRLCLTSSHSSIQEEHSTVNFQLVTRRLSQSQEVPLTVIPDVQLSNELEVL